MLPALQIVAPLAKMLFSTVDKAVADKDLAAKLKAELQIKLMETSAQEVKAAASVIEAEAKSNLYVSSWRPTLMYVLIFILIWNYILGPFMMLLFKAQITFTLPGDVWTLLTVGLGGYTIGRSAESVARTMSNKPNGNGNGTKEH